MELWSEDDTLMLLTPGELENLPDGAKLTSISGQTMIWTHQIPIKDFDLRFGVTAWGLFDGKAEYIP